MVKNRLDSLYFSKSNNRCDTDCCKQKVILSLTRGLTPKRATRSGIHLRSLAPGNITPEERRSGDETLATLSPIRPAENRTVDLPLR